MPEALQLPHLRAKLGWQKPRTDTGQIERHPLEQPLVIVASLLEMVLERLAQPLEALFEHVVQPIELITACRKMAWMLIGQTLAGQSRCFRNDGGICLELLFQDRQSYTVHNSPF